MATGPVSLIDSHVHLDYDTFDSDRQDVIDRAHEAGVHTMITIGCRLPSIHRAIQIAERHPSIYAAIGIHPHQAAETNPDEMRTIQSLLKHPKVVGVGETGLDYFYQKSPQEIQRQVFRQSIQISQQSELPLIIHTRDAEEDTLRLLREEHSGSPYRGVIHCFTSTLPFAEACIEMGFYLSISGIATFAKSLQKVIKQLPLHRLLVETDAPYLTPVPHRGERNEPAYVRHTAQKLADLFKMPLDELASQTTANTRALFQLPHNSSQQHS